MAEVGCEVARVLSLVLLLVGCGGGSGLPRAQARSAGPRSALRSRGSRKPTRDRVVGCRRANLQARLRSGRWQWSSRAAAARRYSAVPCAGAIAGGARRCPRVDRDSQPRRAGLYAPSRRAGARRGTRSRSRLAVRTAVGGQYVLEGSSAADVPDYGDCAAALLTSWWEFRSAASSCTRVAHCKPAAR